MKHLKAAIFLPAAAMLTTAKAADDRPLALVEHVEAAPEAGVEAFDYVYEDDKIDLRPGGSLSLAYFDSCEVETFTGGVLKLKDDGVKISKDGVSTKSARPCQTASLMLSDEAREAGVAVKRVTPFPEDEWREISVATTRPTFIWPSEGNEDGATTLSVFLLEADPVQLVWEANAAGHFLTYPEDAPLLMPGLPYQVAISRDGKVQTSVVFSIDPGLELPDGALTTAVPLGL